MAYADIICCRTKNVPRIDFFHYYQFQFGVQDSGCLMFSCYFVSMLYDVY